MPKSAIIFFDLLSKVSFFLFFDFYYKYLSKYKTNKLSIKTRLLIGTTSAINSVVVCAGFIVIGYMPKIWYILLLMAIFLILALNTNIYNKHFEMSLFFIIYTIVVARLFFMSIILLFASLFNATYYNTMSVIRYVLPTIVGLSCTAIFYFGTKNNQDENMELFVKYKNQRQIMLNVLMFWSILVVAVSDNLKLRTYTPVLSLILFFFTIVSLMSVYLLLNLSYKHQVLLMYMEKMGNVEAELKIKSGYLDAFISKSPYTYEANVSKNLITNGFATFDDIILNNHNNYDRSMEEIIPQVVYPEDQQRVLRELSSKNIIANYINGERTLEIKYKRLLNNQYKYVKMILSITCDEHTHDIRMFSYLLDIHEKTVENLKLVKEAQKDLLTDLYNKLTTQKLIGDALIKHKGALFMIDIDNFKHLNDTYGHSVGDKSLCYVSKAMQQVFRSSDILGRVGGDEFMSFMLDVTDKEAVLLKSQALKDTLNKIMKDENSVPFTISVGAIIIEELGTTFNDAYIKVDNLMYESKHKGKNQYTVE